MIEGIPWPALTAASGGWALFGLMATGLITGRWLVSRREADTYLQRAEKAEANVETLVATVADLTAVSKLQKATIDAALRARAMQGTLVPTDNPEAGDGA